MIHFDLYWLLIDSDRLLKDNSDHDYDYDYDYDSDSDYYDHDLLLYIDITAIIFLLFIAKEY